MAATVDQVVNFAKDLANKGKGVDFDGYYGTQCVDLPNWILGKYFGKAIWGNAIDLLNSAKQAGYTVIYDAPGVNPKRGDIFVMRTSHPYGHTGLVIEDSNGYQIKTIEQNVDGNANSLSVGGPARYITRNFTGIVGWIRPPYTTQQTTTTQKATPAPAGKIKDENGTMTVQVSAVNVRDAATVKGKAVATYKKGQSFKYDSVYRADGYIWVSYIGGSGKRRYVAAGVERNGVNVSPYGTFK